MSDPSSLPAGACKCKLCDGEGGLFIKIKMFSKVYERVIETEKWKRCGMCNGRGYYTKTRDEYE